MAYFGTTTPLGSNGTVTLGPKQSDRADYISGAVFADQGGTIYIEQSGDGTNFDISAQYTVTGGDGKGFSEYLYLPYVRIRYVNGGSAQAAFRLFARYTSAGDS